MTVIFRNLWLVRLGRDGEHEPEALDRNRDEIVSAVFDVHPRLPEAIRA